MSTATALHNKLLDEDKGIHDWYRFVLSFPPHLVREYIERFDIGPSNRVLDPFCGTGTTPVECKLLGIPSVGIEANPMAHLATAVKVNWTADPEELVSHASRLADTALSVLEADGISDELFFNLEAQVSGSLCSLDPERMKLLLRNSISPLPLHKVLVVIQSIEEAKDARFYDHERLALARVAVQHASNLHFGPEVGVRRAKDDAPVVGPWMESVRRMAEDLRAVRKMRDVPSDVYLADSREPRQTLTSQSVDFVFTSPPYPNEKDYTRATRLESVLLGFVTSKMELRALKKTLVRSNTRNVYKEDNEDALVSDCSEIEQIAAAIEERRVALKKTSGFERMYARVTKLYFGGMKRHLAELREVLKPGAILAYVVGDQASYLRIMIPTGSLLADIAESLGYKVLGIDLFRTRIATATKRELREEVVLLQWKGKKG